MLLIINVGLEMSGDAKAKTRCMCTVFPDQKVAKLVFTFYFFASYLLVQKSIYHAQIKRQQVCKKFVGCELTKWRHSVALVVVIHI